MINAVYSQNIHEFVGVLGKAKKTRLSPGFKTRYRHTILGFAMVVTLSGIPQRVDPRNLMRAST